MHPDDIQLEAEGTVTAHQPENSSPTKHITVRASSDMLTEYAIDEAIEKGLRTLTKRIGKPLMLLCATPIIRADGATFVTVVVHPNVYQVNEL